MTISPACSDFCSSVPPSHLIFGVPLSKLYTNSLMSSLNARVIWKFPLGSSRPHFANGDSTLTKSQVRSVSISFHMSVRPLMFPSPPIGGCYISHNRDQTRGLFYVSFYYSI